MYRTFNVAGICIGLLCAWGAANPLRAQSAGAIRSVTLANTLPANDDDSTDAVPLGIGGTGGINFFGQPFTQVYVNNNGNLTFSDSLSDFTPNGLAQGVGIPIIAPFFADVDTTGTGSGVVQYGNATINGFNTFVANYINVGYFDANTDKLNSFQVVLYDRSDTGAGNFDIEFNYNQILWETGDASGGTDGLGGTSAAVGYSNGLTGSDNIYFQLTGSLVDGALINGGPDALVSHSLNSAVPGRYVFPVRAGAVTLLLSNVACLPGLLGQGGVSSCTVTLTGNAPAGAATTIALSSSSSSLTVPASVTVAAGANSATFNATASAGIASNQIATVTATFGGNSQSATVNLTSAAQSGYIGVFYYSTPPSPCPAALSVLCAANNTVNNQNGGVQDGPVFVFVNTSGTPITNGVLTIVGVDFFDVGTIAANSSVIVIPGVSNDGQNHGSDNFFTVTGGIYDSSDLFPSLNSTPFKFTGQQGAAQIQSADICGVVPAPIFTPACTAGLSNDGTTTGINFLGGPGDNDGSCDNCFGPAIVALLGTFTSSSTSGSALSITSASLPGVSTGVSYSQQLAAAGGTPPYTWTLVGGSLPAGMGLASAGAITGTSAKAGTYTFTAKVTDSTGAFVVGSFSVSVAPPAVTITTPSPLPSGMITVDYPLQVLSASGGYGPYTFTVPANLLPAGLTLASNGSISGTPTVTGTFPFTLTATDLIGQTGSKSLQITVRPFSADLTISAGSLSFSMAAGATALPGSQTVQVESTDVTKALSWSATITPSQTWLSVSAGGSTPGSFTVSLTSGASFFAASTTPYQATIVVACLAPSPCAGSSQSIAVSILVSAISPELTVLTDLLSFTTSSTSPQSTTQSLGVQNTGGGTFTIISATCPQSWCTVGPLPGSLEAGVTGAINITANPAGLSPGFYFADLTIVSSAGTTAVPVTFFVAANPSLALEPSGVQLIMPAGGVAAVPDTSFLVSVSGTAPVAWTAAVLPGAPWLNLSTASGTSTGTAPGAVNYSINQSAAGALTSQAYYATIRVTSTSVVNSPQDFQVVLDVTATSVKEQPNPTPAGLIFIAPLNGTAPAQIDQVFASSATATAYQAAVSTADGSSWLSVNPPTGTTSSSSPAQTNISVSPASLTAGVYHGSVSYSLSAAAVRTVNVTLVVESAGQSASLRTSQTETSHAACAPSQIIPTQTALVNNFAQPASWPTPLEIQLANDCGSPVSNGQVVATFSNGDPPLALSIENPSSGLYSGTWTPRNTGSQVTVTATATAPGFTAATARISGSVIPNAAPTLNPNGTLNVFTPVVGAPLAPGTILQIYGTGLATKTLPGTTIPLATNLAGTSVIIGGVQVPLYFVSPGQVNAQMPFELVPGLPYQVIVSNNGALSTPLTIQSVAVTPEIAAYSSGYAIAQHAATYSLITDASPAQPGEVVTIYLAGMGPTTVPVASGAASPSGPYALTADAPTITLNSELVTVIAFSGLTPTLAGLYQIDLQVPADAPNGDLTLVVSQPGFQATSVILPVHN
jgi:uncharacterized protein (TIGR03437 family)